MLRLKKHHAGQRCGLRGRNPGSKGQDRPPQLRIVRPGYPSHRRAKNEPDLPNSNEGITARANRHGWIWQPNPEHRSERLTWLRRSGFRSNSRCLFSDRRPAAPLQSGFLLPHVSSKFPAFISLTIILKFAPLLTRASTRA